MFTLNPARPRRRRRNHEHSHDHGGYCCAACARGNPCEDDCPGSESNPTGGTVALWLGGALAAFGVGYMIYEARHKAPYGQKVPPEQALAGMLVDGEILGAAPSVVADVMQPVALAITSPSPEGYSHVEEIVVRAPGTLNEEPQSLRNVEFGSGSGGVPNDMMWEGRLLDGTIVTGVAPANADKAIASLVTGVTGDTANAIYEAALGIISKYGADWEDGGQRDAMTIQILQFVAPGVDWSQGLQPYAHGDAPSRFWNAAQLIGSVAEQSLMNKQAQAGG